MMMIHSKYISSASWMVFFLKNIRNETVMRFIIRIRLVDCEGIFSLCKEMHRATMCICVPFNNRDTLWKINYKFIQIHCQTFRWNKRFNKPNWFRLLLFDGQESSQRVYFRSENIFPLSKWRCFICKIIQNQRDDDKCKYIRSHF